MEKHLVLPGTVRVDEMTQTKCVYDLTHCSSNAYVQKRMHSGSKAGASSPGIPHLCYSGGLEWRGLVWRPDTMRRYGCCWWRYGTLIWGLVQPGALPASWSRNGRCRSLGQHHGTPARPQTAPLVHQNLLSTALAVPSPVCTLALSASYIIPHN